MFCCHQQCVNFCVMNQFENGNPFNRANLYPIQFNWEFLILGFSQGNTQKETLLELCYKAKNNNPNYPVSP